MRATLREAKDPAAFAESFTGRMQSMTASFDILVAREWTAADLESLAQHQLAAYGSGDRIGISGPRVELPPELAVPVGLTLHELGTNAAKHGALSNPNGTVMLNWSVVEEAGEKQVHLEWREQGGPAVEPPTRIGFGSMLIEKGLAQGRIARRFERTGLICTIDLVIPIK